MKLHLLKENWTKSDKFDASIQKMIEDKDRMPRHRAMMSTLSNIEAATSDPCAIRPAQPRPLKKVHYSSPLRGNKSPSRDYSPARPTMSTGTVNRGPTMASSNDMSRSTGDRRFESEQGLIKILNEHIYLERGLERAK